MKEGRISGQTWRFQQDIRILGTGTAVGPHEGKGPLAEDFDIVHDDFYVGQDTWEKAERKLFEEAVDVAVQKSGVDQSMIDLMLGGDLLNQTVSATFTARYMQRPFLGMFGACSASMETLATAAALVDAGFARYAIAGCSSHNAATEKQYRYPTEYGGQKKPTAQWTVTGAGAAVIGIGQTGPRVRFATIGKVTDYGLKDPMDMGSAMAPAAVSTIKAHFQDTGRKPQDYDLIVTGDLASVGYPIAKKLLQEEGYRIEGIYQDCGKMMYAPDQQVFAGGSGCACSACVTYGHILRQMSAGKLRRVLVVATGALLSPLTYQQGESIPCIAHAVSIEQGVD